MKRIDTSKLSNRQMQKIMDAITLYWNFFVPAFPDGRTPAEAAEKSPPPWMQSLLAKYKEKLDIPAVRIHFLDRINEITGEILSELQEGLSTPRTQAIAEIMEGLEKHGPPEQDLKKTLWEQTSASKHKPAFGKPSKLPAITIPYVSLYRVRDARKARSILREYSRRKASTEKGSCHIKEDRSEGSFTIYEWTGTIGVRLGTLSFLPQGGLFIGSLTSTRMNALHKFLTELMKENLTLVEEMRDVELPPP